MQARFEVMYDWMDYDGYVTCGIVAQADTREEAEKMYDWLKNDERSYNIVLFDNEQ